MSRVLRRAKQVLATEAQAIRELIPRLDRHFERAVSLMTQCKGRVVVTGMGKPGIIAQKLSATLASTGTPSLFLHPAEAIHGDLGRVTRDDVVIVLSNSGETEEITRLLPIIKKIGATLIAVSGNARSTLAKHSDCIVDAGVREEACPLGLAPTTSTTALLAIGDALAMALLEQKGFRTKDFATLHPGGLLGRKLWLTVGDLMRTGKANPVAKETARVKEVLLAITQSRAGAACVVDSRRRLVGIFTDGDLRRHLELDPRLVDRMVAEVMTRRPTTVRQDQLAVEALRILQEKRIDEVPVVDAQRRVVGMLDVQDLLKAGLV